MDLNKVMLIGRLTADPQTRTLPTSGQSVTSFSVATGRRWKSATGETKEETQFHNIVAWRKLGEICAQYMKKGMRVYIEGSVRNRSWVGTDGQKKYRTEIFADNAIMLDYKAQEGQSGNFGNKFSKPAGGPAAQNNNIAIPSPEQIPTIDINDEQEEVKIEDIPF